MGKFEDWMGWGLGAVLTACGGGSEGAGADGGATGTATTTNTGTSTTGGSASASTSTDTTGTGAGGSGTTTTGSNSTTGVPSLPCSMPTQSCEGMVIAENVESAAAFTLVPPYLYYKETGRLMRVQLDPLGSPEVLATAAAASLTADANYAYFTVPEGSVYRIALPPATEPEELANVGAPLLDVEVDSQSIFVTAPQAGVFSLPLAGGAATPLLAGDASIVELIDEYAYVTVRAFELAGETFDGVVRVPRTGGDPEKVYGGSVVHVVEPADDGVVLLTDTNVLYQPFGAAAIELFTCSYQCGSVVRDGTQIFVTHSDGPLGDSAVSGYVHSVPLAGGEPTLVGQHTGSLFSIRSYLDRLMVSHYGSPGQLLSFGKCPCQ